MIEFLCMHFPALFVVLSSFLMLQDSFCEPVPHPRARPSKGAPWDAPVARSAGSGSRAVTGSGARRTRGERGPWRAKGRAGARGARAQVRPGGLASGFMGSLRQEHDSMMGLKSRLLHSDHFLIQPGLSRQSQGSNAPSHLVPVALPGGCQGRLRSSLSV